MQLMLIPPGEYMMGRSEEQFDKLLALPRKDGPKPARIATWEMLMMPAHRVRITKPFYMGATEVTVERQVASRLDVVTRFKALTTRNQRDHE